MQERPNKLALLMAISRFLVDDVRPALSDPRLSFRALIAANLAGIVASELASEDAHVTRELDRLRAIFPEVAPAPASFEDRRALLAALNGRLAKTLREAETAPAEITRIARLLRETLHDKLSIDNPRFDTSLDIE